MFLSTAGLRFMSVNEVMVSSGVEMYMTEKVNYNYLSSITGIFFLNLITVMM